MEDGPKAYGEQLFSRLQGKGLSKSQVYKALSLQKLVPEVSELGVRGLLTEAQLVEISKISSAARQKQVAELSVSKGLPATWIKQLTRLIRSAERAPDEREGNRYWDFFFEIKEKIEQEGTKRSILKRLKSFHTAPSTPKAKQPVETAAEIERQVHSFNKLKLSPGRGLDVGTVNICAAARLKEQDRVVYNIQRNAFLDVRSDPYTKKMLMKLGIDYITQGDKGYVIGDPAFELANIFEKNTRRPMKDGMISPLEPEALLIVGLLASELLGYPQSSAEICAFSVPSDPIDADRNVIYHRGSLEGVLRKLGYTPRPMLEGHAVVFGELQEQDYTGIGISCGGGMFNVCVAYKSVPALTFSTSRGGDWIDNNVASAMGLPQSQVCATKETGVDLKQPTDRVQEAVVIYYRELIHYTLELIRQKFEQSDHMPSFSNPVDLVCAGGTSLISGFIDIFREEFEKVHFPIDVANIRLAKDPLRTVSVGCLQAAIEETRSLYEAPIDVAPATLERAAATPTTPLAAPQFADALAYRNAPPPTKEEAPVAEEAEELEELPSPEAEASKPPPQEEEALEELPDTNTAGAEELEEIEEIEDLSPSDEEALEEVDELEELPDERSG